MGARQITFIIGAATVATWAPLGAPGPSASALPCPDVEVVFARGTTEDPGVGPTGQAFVDALRARVKSQSVGVYPVNYPATTDFPTAIDGVRDASAHVLSTAVTCPTTQMVLGGFSQGAAVMGYVTDNMVPDGAPDGVPNPMPPDVANHVAAVALFGKPNTRFMRVIHQPQVQVGPLYEPKTIDLCVPEDLICSSGLSMDAHTTYAETGMVDQAANFTVSHLAPPPAAPPQTAAPAAPPQTAAPAAPPQTAAPAAPPQTPPPASPPQTPPPASPPPSVSVPTRPTTVQLPTGTLMSCQVGCQVSPLS